MTDNIDIINSWKHRALTAEKKLEEIERIARNETDTRMLFADKESFCDFCKITEIIQGVENEY